MNTKDIEIIQKMLGLSQEDQVEVLNYIDHLAAVKKISATEHHDQALREIQHAFTHNVSF